MCNFVSYFVCVILCICVFLCDILLPSGVINDDDDNNGWSYRDKAIHLKAVLAGAAEGLLSPHKLNYTALVRRLRDRFGTAEQQEQFRVELKYRRRQPNESLQELSQAIERLVLRAYPKVPPETRDVLATEAFIDSLTVNHWKTVSVKEDLPHFEKR